MPAARFLWGPVVPCQASHVRLMHGQSMWPANEAC